LLAAAEAAGFEILITADQEIPYQQNLDGIRISIIILCAPTNRLADLKRLAPAVLLSLISIEPGQVIRLDRALHLRSHTVGQESVWVPPLWRSPSDQQRSV
jgi:hypothetical protein